MATTTATITLASSDIADNSLSISNTMTMTTAGTTTGITETTGLARKKVASASLADLITVANTDVTAAKSAKVYIKNTSTATDKYGLIGVGDSSGTPIYLGRLYGGDWMLFPWDANSGEDITLTMSDATETVIEYMVFFE
uniref:Uncharacterized protein n=1 Tax=Virus NIOZ-UU157 TaxID=2763269 RepID=A0A7S9XGP7_9VIRU|nr:MAG: hypothetical protein NIOZUU157_00157 [Virus NIOZ-UU157]